MIKKIEGNSMLTDRQIRYIAKTKGLPKEKIKRIIEECEKYGIPTKGYVFRREPEEIAQIVELCKDYNLDYNKNDAIFNQTPADAKIIIKLCIINRLRINNKFFEKNAEQLTQSIPVLKDLGIVRFVQNTPSVLNLTAEQIWQRCGALYYLNVPLHKIGRYSQDDKLHMVFTYSEEKFHEFLEKHSIANHIERCAATVKRRIEELKRAPR